jgi:nucleoside phosphorylase
MDNGVLSDIRAADMNCLRHFIYDDRFVAAFRGSQGSPVKQVFRRRSGAGSTGERVEALVITALPEEKDAFLAIYGRYEKRTFPNDSHIYYVVNEKVADRILRIVIAHPDQMGEAPASATATEMLRTFDAKFILVVGVAGGCPNPCKASEHVRLGDVVVATEIFKYDHVRRLSSRRQLYRDKAQPVGSKWLQILSSCRNPLAGWDAAWESYLLSAMEFNRVLRPKDETDILRSRTGEIIGHPFDPDRTGLPKVFTGLIASGATLLKDPVLRDKLRDTWNARAVEMESSGVRDAARTKQKEIIAVRGIMDYCDSMKGDKWKAYAALSAAAFARMLISRIPYNWL